MQSKECCGWTAREIASEVKRRLAECESQKERDLVLSIAAEAKAKGNSWPLRPKFVPAPPMHLNDWYQ